MKLFALALALAPSVAVADAVGEPAVPGATFEAAIGGGLTTFAAPVGSIELETHRGLALGASAGWFVTPNLALGLRVELMTVGAQPSTFVGPSIQYWFGDRVWYGAAAGVDNVSPPDDERTPTDTGVSVRFRVGFNLPSYWSERHMFSFSVESKIIDPITHDRGALAAALLVGYQYR